VGTAPLSSGPAQKRTHRVSFFTAKFSPRVRERVRFPAEAWRDLGTGMGFYPTPLKLHDRKRARKEGKRVPAIGLGTWQLDGEHAVEALVDGVKAGAWLIDTAEAYGTEGLVGQALKKLKDEGVNVFLATKVSPSHFHHDDVIKSCEASLSRLGVKAVDLYQLHWPNHSIPIAETMGAMEELVKAGKIRYIGVSNFSSKELDEARASLKREDVVSDQVKYSPFDRHVEPDLFPYCEKEGITVRRRG